MANQVNNQRVALMIAPGFEEIEALTVADLLRRVDVSCELISITNSLTVESTHGIAVVCDACVNQLDLSVYDMIVLPGGMPGTLNLKSCAALTDAVCAFVEANKDVAAICAAPSILAELGLLSGKEATVYPALAQVLEEHGATVLDSPVVEAGPIITSQGMGTAMHFGLAIVGRLLGGEAAERLAVDVVWRTEHN